MERIIEIGKELASLEHEKRSLGDKQDRLLEELRSILGVKSKPIVDTENSIEVTLCGKKLLIDKENFEIDGKKYFTWKEIMEIAKAQGKRLLTKKEYEELIELSHKWDEEKKGMWIGELFFPACGFRANGSGSLRYQGTSGYYWSVASHSSKSVHASLLYFYGNNVYVNSTGNRTDGFSVRLVREIV